MVILADPDLKLWESSMGICQAPGVGFLPMFFPRFLENSDKIIFSLILCLFILSKMAENGILTKYDDQFVKFQSNFKRTHKAKVIEKEIKGEIDCVYQPLLWEDGSKRRGS